MWLFDLSAAYVGDNICSASRSVLSLTRLDVTALLEVNGICIALILSGISQSIYDMWLDCLGVGFGGDIQSSMVEDKMISDLDHDKS